MSFNCHFNSDNNNYMIFVKVHLSVIKKNYIYFLKKRLNMFKIFIPQLLRFLSPSRLINKLYHAINIHIEAAENKMFSRFLHINLVKSTLRRSKRMPSILLGKTCIYTWPKYAFNATNSSPLGRMLFPFSAPGCVLTNLGWRLGNEPGKNPLNWCRSWNLI